MGQTDDSSNTVVNMPSLKKTRVKKKIDKQQTVTEVLVEEEVVDIIEETVEYDQAPQEKILKKQLNEIANQKKKAEDKVKKIAEENEKLRKENELVQEKIETISSTDTKGQDSKENPTNEEKLEMVGGTKGFLNTAIEQITGTGEFDPNSKKRKK